MTIDVPVDSPQGKVVSIDLSNSFIRTDEEDNISNLNTSDPDGIPLVILKKLENENTYYVVSSNRIRTTKNFEDFEMEISATNLKKIETQSVSPKKRARPRKTEGDLSSPIKIPKTPTRTYSKKDNVEDNVDNLCISLKNNVKLITPVKRSLNKTDFSDVELMDSSPRKKEAQGRTPVKDTPKRGRSKMLANGSSMKVDENELLYSGKRRSQTPQKLKSVKLNLDESFRRSVLKSAVNLDNVRREPSVHSRRVTRGSIARQSTPPKSIIGTRKSACQSYSSFFYYDTDSDNTEETSKQNKKAAVVKRRILRSRNNSTSSNTSDWSVENELDCDDENEPTKNRRRRLRSGSDSDSSDNEVDDEQSKSSEIVLPQTPSRRKQILRPRQDSTSSNVSDISELSPQRKEPKEIAKTPRTRRTRKDSVPSNASEKSPERRSPREIAKTPKTPRRRNVAAATPKRVKATPKTPKNRLKLLRDGVITPSMHSRSSIIPGDSTPLMKARSQLHVSYVPTSLPCREREYLDVYNFLRGKLEDGYGGCMYISGVPGTGKTATVTSVIENLQKDRKVQDFSYVSVNGMRLTEPRQSYVEIWKQLTGKTIPWEQAQSLLEERFTKAKKSMSPVVMLIDELDVLCTKRQDVVYNLLDWPSKSKDQLVVITIANTMDLPERLLMSRVTSRLGLTRLTFQAYTHKQLMEIVTKRLTGTDSFNPDAIQLVARKVASVSGDARRALDICRRAAEIAEEEGKGQLVNIMHINEALNAMMTQPQVMAIRRCSRLQKLLLQAIVAEIERTGVEETTFSDVFRILVSCCALDGFKMVSSTAAQRAICGLSAYRLIITDQKCSNIFQKIMLNVSIHDVYFALKKE